MTLNSKSERSETPKLKKPLVAIVGRPNVGKSTLFNRIIEWEKAIVEDIPGVTRDRIYGDAEWKNKEYSVVDTGGLVLNPKDESEHLIKEQVQIALDEADLILFVMDVKQGLMPFDQDILQHLRKSQNKVIYVVNKIDHEKHNINSLEFHKIGIEKFTNISALHNRNTYELIKEIVENLPWENYQPLDSEDNEAIRISVIGKPNVGKSTLINTFLGENRLITSPVPGTTRDSIDSTFEYNNGKFLIIDTAGIRRKAKVNELLERYSVLRAIRSIARSDIVLFMIDAAVGPTHHDSRLAKLVEERGAASIVLLNKWDLAPDEIKTVSDIESITSENLKVLKYSPVVKISALTGKRVNKILESIKYIYENYSKKITTRKLNIFLEELKKKRSPGVYKGSELKFYYMTQPYTKPPTFVIFSNARNGIPENYKRFIENQLRENFDFTGCPIKLIFRTRKDDNAKS